MAKIGINGLQGFVNKYIVIEPNFEDADDVFREGLITVKLDGKWGVINKKGDWVLEPEYEEIEDGESIRLRWSIIDYWYR